MREWRLVRMGWWMERHIKQTAWRGLLFMCVRMAEDRTRLKQENRRLSTEIESLRDHA